MRKIGIAIATVLMLMIPLVQAEEEQNDAIDFVSKIEMMKGHLHASLLNKEAGNDELAAAHAGHPAGEIYILIKDDVASKDPEFANELEDALNDLINKARELSFDEYKIEVDNVKDMLDEAVDKVVGSEAKDPDFLMRVIIDLLEEAEREYEEGVKTAGEISDIIEYQDAQGFIATANELFNSIKSSIKEDVIEEFEQSFEQLNDAIKGVASIEDVEQPIKSIIHEFEEILGIERVEEKPTIAEMRLMLDSVLEEYEEGKYDEALEIATKAYLEKYEFLEADIAKVDEELMEETEIMLRVELRQLIKDRASIEEIEAKIEEIKANLDKIEALGIGVGEDPRLTYVSNIEVLLDKIVEEYEEGKYDEAEKLIIEAYLENYELIEKDVKSYDKELNEEFERLLTVELATKIKERASVDDVKATVDMIKAKLDIIETQVVPEFPIAIIALASIMGILVVATRSKIS